MSRLSKINDLAFDLVHEVMEPSEQFSYAKQIYDLSDEPELGENQQIVLDWLKEKYTVTNIEPIELFWRLRVNSIKPDYRDRPVYRSYRYMSKTGQLQVLQAFSRWAIEQEEAE
ncbi:hypothetical protein AAFB02_000202 [Enterococcus faecalis]